MHFLIYFRKKLKTDDSSSGSDQEMNTTSDDKSTILSENNSSTNSGQSNQSIIDRSTKIDNQHDLPPPIFSNVDCLIRIFSYLSLRDRRSIESTCKCWRNIILNETPLNKSILSIKIYEQQQKNIDRQLFRVTFDDCFWQVPFVIRNNVQQQNGGGEIDIDTKTQLFFQRFLFNYGTAVRRLDFGGDYLPIFDQSIQKTTPRLRGYFLQEIDRSCLKNLKSITFRQVLISDYEWQRLAETIDILTSRGCLEILRFISIVGHISSPDISLSLAVSVFFFCREDFFLFCLVSLFTIGRKQSNQKRARF